METRLGLSPQEMIEYFNQMYLDVWDKTRDKIDWEAANITRRLEEGQNIDIGELLLRVCEVVVTAARDGAVLAMFYNNERVADDLRKAGIALPEAGSEAATAEGGKAAK